jgi:hypothetical protein
MSDEIGILIDYDVPFTRENIRTVLAVLDVAVQDNWRLNDRWSDPEPKLKVELEQWLNQCTPNSMSDLSEWTQSDSFYFEFSPLSAWVAYLIVCQEENGALSVMLNISKSVIHERQGHRERYRMKYEREKTAQATGKSAVGKNGSNENDPSSEARWAEYQRLEDTRPVWGDNKKCLLHIIDRLKSVFPVREVHIDAELLERQCGE